MEKLFTFGRAEGAARGPRGRRAYAVGDIHGCLDELERLLDLIEGELRKRPNRKTSIIFLGDLIDRGPASAQVVERLRTYRPEGTETHFLMGNHEEVMLRVLSGETDFLRSWLKFGGDTTLRSYGVEPREFRGKTSEEIIKRLQQAIPVEHLEFVKGFADSISFGNYLFVHAGIRPGIDLAQQSPSDLRWIREPFLSDATDHGFTVVHGHTITNEVEITPNRIGIDTGTFRTGTLTALAIEGGKRWLLQTASAAAERQPLE